MFIMNEKIDLWRLILTIGIIVCFLLAFLLPYIMHVVLTHLYADQFQQYYWYRMEGEARLFRVLTYTGNMARVYYVGGTGCFVHECYRNNGAWERESIVQISHLGNAYEYEYVWPYLFNTDDGIVLFVFYTYIAFITILLAYLLMPYIIKIATQTNQTNKHHQEKS